VVDWFDALAGVRLAFLHEGIFGRAAQLFTACAYRLRFACRFNVGLAFLYRRILGSTCKGFPVLAHGLGFTGRRLRKGAGGKQGEDKRNDSFHEQILSCVG